MAKTYFILGIGGSGMSSLAHILLDSGNTVLGYDRNRNRQIEVLLERNVPIFGSPEDFLQSPFRSQIDATVHSSAIRNHPLMDWSHREHIPVLHRSQVMHEWFGKKVSISIAGSHGKTTTTAMVSQILQDQAKDPAIMIGGETPLLGERGGYWGMGEYGVYESDESDGTFLNHHADYRLLTNIDEDHLDYYKTKENLISSFCQHLESPRGVSILYFSDPGIQEAVPKLDSLENTIVISQEPVNEPERFLKVYQLKSQGEQWLLTGAGKTISYRVPFLGDHYKTNASLAIALGWELGLDSSQMAASLSRYKGVKRRMEILYQDSNLTILDDYGHHPTEVSAVLRGLSLEKLKGRARRTIVLFQPHRFTRTQNLYREFADSLLPSDRIFLLPIYSAGEAPIEGVNSESIAQVIRDSGKSVAILSGNPNEDVATLEKELRAGDLLVCLGAGNVRTWGEMLAKRCPLFT